MSKENLGSVIGPQGPTGATGPQGPPGAYTFDTAPTQDSTNPVTSGGIYTVTHALQSGLLNIPTIEMGESAATKTIISGAGVYLLVSSFYVSGRFGLYLVNIHGSNASRSNIVTLFAPADASSVTFDLSTLKELKCTVTASANRRFRAIRLENANY